MYVSAVASPDDVRGRKAALYVHFMLIRTGATLRASDVFQEQSAQLKTSDVFQEQCT